MKKILYIRSGPYEVNYNDYNLQEIGLGRALCSKGYDVDIVYYTKKNNRIQTIDSENDNTKLRILWTKGIKILRTGIYPTILKKEFLSKYNVVIISEYSQIMTVLVSHLHKNVYIYNGIYYNLFKIPIMEFVYDKLFCNYLDKNVKHIFCKTNMSKKYLEKKGLNKCSVVGVGLDTEKFKQNEKIETKTKELLNKMNNHRNILYVGSISKRKNVEILVKAFNLIKRQKEYNDVQFIIIGKNDKRYLEYCKSLIDRESDKSVIYTEHINNSQLKNIYNNADLFMLASKQEIFGMVLLEAMYFGVPTISSKSAGAETLIINNESGFLIDGFNENDWYKKIIDVIDDKEKCIKIGKKAHNRIIENFMWDNIADKMLKNIKKNEIC